MEKPQSPEKGARSLVLRGNKYLTSLAMSSKIYNYEREWGEYGMFQVRETATSFSGGGVIAELNGHRELVFEFEEYKKVHGARYDDHKPEHLAEVFYCADAYDSKEFADAVAETMLDLAKIAAEEPVPYPDSDAVVWYDPQTDKIKFDLVNLSFEFDEILIQKGVVPEHGGQFRLPV